MFEYRVTKYDPAHRDEAGRYPFDEWHLFAQIGQPFGGVTLTRAEYERVEDAYVTAAVAFVREAGVPSLTVTGLENSRQGMLPFVEGSSIDLDQTAGAIRLLLREECWFRLEAGEAFVHVGWDYYMYVGAARRCPNAEARARELGLFVEPFRSPYRDRPGTGSVRPTPE